MKIVDTYFSETAGRWFFTIVVQNEQGVNSTITCEVPEKMIWDMQRPCETGSGS